MDLRVIFFVLSRLVLASMGVVVVPLFLALCLGEGAWRDFALTLGLSIFVWLYLMAHARREVRDLSMREGIAITGLGWLIITVLGMMPFLFGGYLLPLDAAFESISGFTGTGATVFPSLASLPQSILFWRSMTHWFGGLGIIVIFIALLPQAGQSTVFMYNAESSIQGHDRVLPRLSAMTGVLFRLYAGLTLAAGGIFFLCGMDVLTAANHALSTVGAGGFSTFDESARAFHSPALEFFMALFMFLAGGNFALYYKVWKKGPAALKKNTEFRVYLVVVTVAALLVAADLMHARGVTPLTALRYAVFQATSLSTTGFVSADYDTWPAFSKGVLLLLMLMGGCAGSTASGLKVTRVVLLVKNAVAVVRETLHPHVVRPVRMNGHTVPVAALHRVGHFFFLYLLTLTAFALLFTLFGVPLFDALGISVTTLGNIGPAFGVAGATETYAPFPGAMKAALCFEMLLGRLEILTPLVMLRPDFWRTRHPW